MSDIDSEREAALPEEPSAETPASKPVDSIFPLYPDPQVEAALTTLEAGDVLPPTPEGSGSEVPPPAPPKRDKKKVLRIAAIALAVVVVLGVAAAFAVPAIIQAVNPKAYLAACLAKTMNGYSDGGDAAAVLGNLSKTPTRSEFYFQMNAPTAAGGQDDLDGKYGLDAPLPDLRYTVALETDYPNRRADLELELSYLGNAMSLLACASDSLVSFGSDDLTGGDYYCINTETLGADVAASPVFSEIGELDPAYGFNLFDSPAVKESPTLTPGTLSLLKQLFDELNKTVTVEKSGSPTVTVFDQESASTHYVMTIPAVALHDYVVRALQALTEDEAFLSAVDFTGTTAEEFVDAMDQLFSTVKDAITINFYISGGRVLLLDASLPMEQEGEVQTYSLLLEFDKDGNALNGTLSDTTGKSGEPSGLSLSYTRDGDNFHLTAAAFPNRALAEWSINGTFTADKAAKRFSLDLSEISITSKEETITFGLGVSLASIDSLSHEPPVSPTPLLEMEEDEVYELLMQVLSGVSSVLTGDAGYSY